MNWRVKIDEIGQLVLSPVLTDSDEGHYECYLNGKLSAGVVFNVDTTFVRFIKGIVTFVTIFF